MKPYVSLFRIPCEIFIMVFSGFIVLIQVKSVYVEAIPSSWSDSKLQNFFAHFGVIERVVHARDIDSAKIKDFAFVNYATREAALL